MRWREVHFQQSPEIAMEVVLIERLDGVGRRRKPKRMWLAYIGATPLALESLRRLYLLRFSVEHRYRFLKQRLYWTLPRFATAEQADRWSALMGPMMTELYLARDAVADAPLPWQKPLEPEQLTSGRVCAGFAAVIAAIGTPTCVPKGRGKSPGWPPGQPRKRRDRYPVVRKKKKAASRPSSTS